MRVYQKILTSPLEAVNLSFHELNELLTEAVEVFDEEQPLVEVDSEEILFVGDTHGDLRSSLSALSRGVKTWIFLGDYVDRGPMQLENVIFLLAKKLEQPDRVYLLRGNHESPLTNVYYGFLDEVVEHFGRSLYSMFVEVFSRMPYAALVNGSVFAVHGGVARGLQKLTAVKHLPKPDETPYDPTAFELLWNDPCENVTGFEPSPRGPGIYLFGRDAYEEFADANGIVLMVRAHEYFPSGVHEYFGGKVVSLFSCRYYPGTSPRGLLLTYSGYKVVDLDL